MLALSLWTHVGQLIEGGIPVVLVVAWAALWVGAFVEVLTAKQEEFAGPYVRVCWVAGLLFAAEFTPFAFLAWHLQARRKRSKSAGSKAKPAEAAD